MKGCRLLVLRFYLLALVYTVIATILKHICFAGKPFHTGLISICDADCPACVLSLNACCGVDCLNCVLLKVGCSAAVKFTSLQTKTFDLLYYNCAVSQSWYHVSMSYSHAGKQACTERSAVGIAQRQSHEMRAQYAFWNAFGIRLYADYKNTSEMHGRGFHRAKQLQSF